MPRATNCLRPPSWSPRSSSSFASSARRIHSPRAAPAQADAPCAGLCRVRSPRSALSAPAAALDVRWTPSSPAQGDVAMVVVPGARAPVRSRARSATGRCSSSRTVTRMPRSSASTSSSAVGKTAWRVAMIDRHGARRDRTGADRAPRRPVSRSSGSACPPAWWISTPRRSAAPTAEAARLRALYASLDARAPLARVLRAARRRRRQVDGLRRPAHHQRPAAHAALRAPTIRPGSAPPSWRPTAGASRWSATSSSRAGSSSLDHGLGLYTLYFHLDRDRRRRGRGGRARRSAIGTVGATGRADRAASALGRRAAAGPRSIPARSG